TASIAVTSVNDEPVGPPIVARPILEDQAYTFSAADFALTDPNDNPVNSLSAVVFTTVPVVGVLKLSGADVTAGQSIAVGDLGNLVYTPVANRDNPDFFTFQVRDNGGTLNGGVHTDQSPTFFFFQITAVNDAPAGADALRTILEDQSYTF